MIREDWVEVELGHVCEKVAKVKRKEMPLEQPLIYIDIGGIDNALNKIVDHKEYTWSDAPSRAQQVVRVGDVLFSTVRTYLKNIAQVTNPKYNNEICSSGFTVIRGQEGILHPRYVFYLTLFEGFLQPLNELQTGTSYPAVRDRDVFAQRIRLAPFPEQRAIVAKIEQLFSELDNGIANLKAAKDKLEIYRQAVLQEAFAGGLIGDEVEWKTKTLKDLLRVSSGKGLTKAERNDDGEYLVYGGNGVTGRHSEYMFEEKQLIIGRVGANCGNVHITKPRSWITDNAFVVSFDETQILMECLYYLLLSLRLNQYASSTAQPVISGGRIYPVVFSLPPKKHQKLLVYEIESRLSTCDSILASIESQLEKSEILRQSILKKAFEGRLLTKEELDVCRREPDWEPTEKLLERIKKQRNEQV